MKLAGPAPASTPTEPVADTPDDGFGGGQPEEQPTSDDKPFDAEPFDAGVEADEQSDPKKFIEQLTGKLGQSLRKYNEDQGQPDFELEKFAINSLLSASHTSEMDANDQDDIIKKVKEAGNNDNSSDEPTDDSSDNESGDDNGDFEGTIDDDSSETEEVSGEINEKKDESFLIKPKKLSIFAPEGSEEANFKHKIVEKLHESFNQEEEMSEPMIEPMVKPAPSKPAPLKTPNTEPSIAPSRKNKPFLPMPEVQPDPKASN